MKNKEGISLIVLIITIVVIIVLATAIIVNIAQSNIIGNANQAVVKQDFKTMQEELNLYIADQFANTNGKFKSSTFNANETSTPSIYDVLTTLKKSKYDGYVTIVNGSIVLSDEMDEKTKEWAMQAIGATVKNTTGTTVTTSDILANPAEYYGKEVEYEVESENLVASNSTDIITLAEQYDNTTWKIFYADSEHIYLIASETLKVSGEEYTKMFTDATEALTYLNTQLNWNSLVNSYADYAIGGPTITMFTNSWNAKYPSNAITITGDDTNGWKVNGKNGIDLEVNDSLYWKQDEWYLLNSKAVNTTFYPMQVNDDCLSSNGWAWNAQYGGENQYYSQIGFRPVICLKTGIALEDFGDELKLTDLNAKVTDATKVCNEAEKYYGKTVNYKTGNSEIDSLTTWQIFHSDGENIYLIAKDYVSCQYIPNTSKGTIAEASGQYYIINSFENVLNDYSSGTGSIASDNPARKWLKKYLDTYTSDADNLKLTAYMLDTDKWNVLYKGENADYAIGGPTVEMFVDSYNKVPHSSSQVSKIYTAVDEYGYYVDVNENPTLTYVSYMDTTGEYNSLYIIPYTPPYDAYYFASPSGKRQDDEESYIHCGFNNKSYGGEIATTTISSPYARAEFRPVICLNANVSLQENADGSYEIIK